MQLSRNWLTYLHFSQASDPINHADMFGLHRNWFDKSLKTWPILINFWPNDLVFSPFNFLYPLPNLFLHVKKFISGENPICGALAFDARLKCCLLSNGNSILVSKCRISLLFLQHQKYYYQFTERDISQQENQRTRCGGRFMNKLCTLQI